jgi:hypothetical protein
VDCESVLVITNFQVISSISPPNTTYPGSGGGSGARGGGRTRAGRTGSPSIHSPPSPPNKRKARCHTRHHDDSKFPNLPTPQAKALQQVEAAAAARARGPRGGAASAGAHGKLKALLFMMQRALCHPKQLSLQQLDTIKRSLQIQQRLGGGAGGGMGAGDDIPLLRIDDMLSRLQGRNAQGGLVRDVGRTWAMAGDLIERWVGVGFVGAVGKGKEEGNVVE